MGQTLTLFDRTIASFFGWGFRISQGEQPTGPGYYYGDSPSAAISDERALQLPTAFGCVRLLAEVQGSIPMELFRRNRDGSRDVATDHEIIGVMKNPNQLMTDIEFAECQGLNLAARGNSYALIQRADRGHITSLWPVPAEMMAVHLTRDNEVFYRMTLAEGRQIDLLPEDVWHVKLFSHTGLVGWSPLSYARRTLGGGVSIQEHSEKFFQNAARPSGVLSMDKILTPKQREEMKGSLQEAIQGVANHYKLLVTEGGMKYSHITFSPEDSQLIEAIGANSDQICEFFRVPPFLLGRTDKVTSWGSGVDSMNLYFLTYTMKPYLNKTSKSATRRLLAPADRVEYFFEHCPEQLLTMDNKSLSEYLREMVNNGLMTRNEARRIKNLPRVAGGDSLTVQSGLIPIELLGKQPEPGLDQQIEKMVKRLIKESTK